MGKLVGDIAMTVARRQQRRRYGLRACLLHRRRSRRAASSAISLIAARCTVHLSTLQLTDLICQPAPAHGCPTEPGTPKLEAKPLRIRILGNLRGVNNLCSGLLLLMAHRNIFDGRTNVCRGTKTAKQQHSRKCWGGGRRPNADGETH